MSYSPQQVPCSETNTKIDKSNFCTEQFSYTWTIDKFSSSTTENGERLLSPVFESKRFSLWRLEVYPWRPDAPDLGHVEVFLRFVSGSKREVFGCVNCSILNAEGKSVFSSSSFDDWFNVACGDTFRSRINMEERSLSKIKKDVLPDDKLSILCEVVIMRDFYPSGTKIQQFKLLDDVAELFYTKKFTDFSINVSGRELTAHKAILASRSEVFAKMFENGGDIGDSNRIAVDDIDYEVIDQMLRFVYTGGVENLEKIADRLLVAADRYGLAGLKDMCEDALWQTIGIENAANVVKLSMINNCGTLQMLAIGYFENHKSEVFQTAGFEAFMQSHPDLAADIRGALEGTLREGDSDSASDDD